jgi:hypothetical protein
MSSSASIPQATDLAHMASIVQGLVAMVQPASRPAPLTPENKTTHAAAAESAPPSPVRNTPSKLSRFLKYAEEELGVPAATGYKDSFRAHGYGPDILHLVDDTALQHIGLSEGDIIRLKQSALRWWNLQSDSNKRKQPDEDVGGSAAQLMPPLRLEPRTPPNLKVRFKKRYHDGGLARVYGPCISPGTLSLDLDFNWTYFCEARSQYVSLPDGYVPIVDE